MLDLVALAASAVAATFPAPVAPRSRSSPRLEPRSGALSAHIRNGIQAFLLLLLQGLLLRSHSHCAASCIST